MEGENNPLLGGAGGGLIQSKCFELISDKLTIKTLTKY
jgi:hypothetical protein